MTLKNGSNESCPCGSGRKYKNCCCDKDAGNPEYKPILSNEDDILKYTEFAERWDYSKGPVPTLMEYLGKPDKAAEITSGLKIKMEDIKSESPKEAREYLNREMNVSNNRPNLEFLGMTPTQIFSLTRNLFAGNSDIVELKPDLSPELVENLSVVKQCIYLLDKLAENEKGIKGTALGNFPVKLTQDFYELFVKDHALLDSPPSKEGDVDELIKMKLFLITSGLVKKQHGWFSLTKKGEGMQENIKVYELYKMIFLYFSDRLNWLSGTSYPDRFEYLQHSLVFCLYILKEKASGFITGISLADVYKTAFPDFVREIDSASRYSMFESGFSYMFIGNYALYLGLVEMEGDKRAYDKEKNLFKTTELFNKLLEWKI